MHLVYHNHIPVYQFSIFSPYKAIIHFSSTRQGGVSENNFHSLNLGNESTDPIANRLQNFERFARSLEIDPQTFCLLHQNHGTGIKIIATDKPTGTEMFFEGYDALITNTPNKCLVIRTADCVPLLLFDPKQKVIAAVHAGWRGTMKRISQKTVQMMIDQFKCHPTSIKVAIGPSISPEVYEVSEDVYMHFENEEWDCDSIFNQSKSNKYLLNLWKANRLQLEEIGVLTHNIQTSGLCTFSSPQFFFSARRDGIESGRMATGIMLTPR